MKKIALLPALAMLILASCSDSEEPVPFPNDPVVTVPAVPDNVTLNMPTQNKEYVYEPQIGSTCYRFSFSNGQQLIISIDNTTMDETVAVVKKIEGTASEVVIPNKVVANMTVDGVKQDVDIPVISLSLNEDACADCVKKITLPASVDKMLDTGKYVTANEDYVRVQVGKCPSVAEFELEDGFANNGFVSIKGAVYTANMQKLIAVPCATVGIFTIAEGTLTVGDYAIHKCPEITAVTFPASISKIGNFAVCDTPKLQLINMLPSVAPQAEFDAFGYAAINGVLRIPAGSLAAYTFVKPELTRPIEPIMPDPTASDEEWDKYDEDYSKFETELAAYESAMSSYNTHAGFTRFVNIEQVTF